MAAGLFLPRTSPPLPRDGRGEVQHLGKRPLSRRGGYAGSLGARGLGLAGGDATRGNAAGNSPGADNSGETETRSREGSIESPAESQSEVGRTLFRSLVHATAEETDKGI